MYRILVTVQLSESDSDIWKNYRLKKLGYPGISQYKVSVMGYPRITWDILDNLKLAYPAGGICKDNISELTYLGISKDKNLKLA